MGDIEVSVLNWWQKKRPAYSLAGKTKNNLRGRPKKELKKRIKNLRNQTSDKANK